MMAIGLAPCRAGQVASTTFLDRNCWAGCSILLLGSEIRFIIVSAQLPFSDWEQTAHTDIECAGQASEKVLLRAHRQRFHG